MSLITSHVQNIVKNQSNIFLNEVDSKALVQFLNENNNFIHSMTLEEQKSLFKSAMENFGLFATLLEVLAILPPLLKFALISRTMYEFGPCGVPVEMSEEIEEFLKSDSRSWWAVDEVSNSIYNLREILVQNPAIGVEPLLSEFSSCGDTSLLYAILENPIVPEELAKSIIDRDHFIFEEYTEDDLEDLILLAEEVLTPKNNNF